MYMYLSVEIDKFWWNELNLDSVCVSYSILSHNCYSLKSDVDVNKMFNLVGILGLRIVEIAVEVSNSCIRSSVAIVNCQRNEISDKESDVLARYYSHEKKVYLTVGWVDCIEKPITDMVDEIRRQVMDIMVVRRRLDVKWNRVLCPIMDKKCQDLIADGRAWNLSMCRPDVYEVLCDPSIVVDLDMKTCSCCKWHIHLFPCSHAVLVTGRTYRNLRSYVDQ
ncbi:hypothetical protein ACSBR1_012008 [Camellia fascicularis]